MANDALDVALTTLDQVTEDWTAADVRVKRLEIALKNCLMLASRRIHKKSPDLDWLHIVRFCSEAGISLSPLRGTVQVTER